MFQFFLIVSILIAVAFIALGVGILIRGKFPDTHVGHNPDMKKMGITCAKDDSALCRGRSQTGGCAGCSRAE